MKKTTLINSEISAVVSKMGHTDSIAVADCGLPIKGSAERIDLALVKGIPDFMSVLNAILSELCVERAVMAEEIKTVSPKMHEDILKALGDKVKVSYVPHEEFKVLTESSKAVVRSGECTPFSNVILYSGVVF